MKLTKKMIKDGLFIQVFDEGSPSWITYDGDGARTVSLKRFRESVDEWIEENNYIEIDVQGKPYHNEEEGCDCETPNFWVTSINISVKAEEDPTFRKKWMGI